MNKPKPSLLLSSKEQIQEVEMIDFLRPPAHLPTGPLCQCVGMKVIGSLLRYCDVTLPLWFLETALYLVWALILAMIAWASISLKCSLFAPPFNFLYHSPDKKAASLSAAKAL